MSWWRWCLAPGTFLAGRLLWSLFRFLLFNVLTASSFLEGPYSLADGAAYLRQLANAEHDEDNDQNEGYGVMGGLRVQKKTALIHVFAESFFRYWNIRQSDREPIISAGSIASYGCEPTNNSKELGLKVGVAF